MVVGSEAVHHDPEVTEHGHASCLAGWVVDEEVPVVEEQVLERGLHSCDVVAVDGGLLGVHVRAGLSRLNPTRSGNVRQSLVGECLLKCCHKGSLLLE